MTTTAKLPQQLPSARGNRHQHFQNLNAYTRAGLPATAMDMRFWQIDEAIYMEFLEMLPPVFVTGGFQMCEKLTGDLAAYFADVGGHFMCGICSRAEVTKLYGRMVKAITG
jgi:hypothetical protein